MTTTATVALHQFVTPQASRSSNTLPPSSPRRRDTHLYATCVPQKVSPRSSLAACDVVVGDQWVVLSKINEGTFGEVFEVRDLDSGRLYAIKREPMSARFPQLKHESNMYDVLAGGPGIPQCHWHGTHDDYDCIVIDLLGSSLKQFRDAVDTIPLTTVIDVGCQMVSTLEHIHRRGLLYRDVKPENFLFPPHCHPPESGAVESGAMSCAALFSQWGEQHHQAPKVYIVDFGLATWWRNPSTKKPYPQAKKPIRNKTGTPLYASLNIHRGKTHSRRDDMESLGYMLMDLYLGTLPWKGVQARNTKAGWDRIRELKEQTPLDDLCAGVPRGFREFMEHTRQLRFADQPDYDFLRRVLRSASPTSFNIHIQSYFGSQPSTQPFPLDYPRHYRRSSLSSAANPTARPHKPRDQGVFDMEELDHELNQLSSVPGSRRRTRSNRKPHSSGKLLEQPAHATQTPHTQPLHTPPHSLPSPQKPFERGRRKGSIGWGSHRRPVPEWTTEGNKPDTLWTRW